MEFLSHFLQYSITFFAILDPIGSSAIALSILGTKISQVQLNDVSKKSTFTILIAFFVVFLSGDFILNLFGISENSLKTMGGLILILMAIKMVNGSTDKNATPNDDNYKEMAIVPIGIPIAFGAGLFSTVIIFKQQAQTMVDMAAVSSAFVLNALLFYLIMRNSRHIKTLLGVTGQNVVTKLMGLIVGAIAVQFIVSGIIAMVKQYGMI